MSSDVDVTIHFEPVFNRSCSECQLCCTLLPVVSLGKGANTRCQYQCRKGCSIYGRHPADCRFWSCRWLTDPATRNLRRPDRVHYCIDPMTDVILCHSETSDSHVSIPCIQIWVDPKHKDAWRTDELRDYMEAESLNGFCFMIRFNEKDGIALIPPVLTAGRGWVEYDTSQMDMVEDDKRFTKYLTGRT